MLTDRPGQWYAAVCPCFSLRPSREDAVGTSTSLGRACFTRVLADRPGQWYAAVCPCFSLRPSREDAAGTSTAEPGLLCSCARRSRLMASVSYSSVFRSHPAASRKPSRTRLLFLGYSANSVNQRPRQCFGVLVFWCRFNELFRPASRKSPKPSTKEFADAFRRQPQPNPLVIATYFPSGH